MTAMRPAMTKGPWVGAATGGGGGCEFTLDTPKTRYMNSTLLWEDDGSPPTRFKRAYANAPQEIEMFSFTQDDDQYVYGNLALPDNWDLDTVLCRIYWTENHDSSGSAVNWTVAIGSFEDIESLNQNYMGAVAVLNDTYQGADLLHITDEVAVTPQHNREVQDLWCVRIGLNAGTHPATPDFIALRLRYGID